MKKTILLGILGLATAATSSFGQGFIQLDNYNSHGGNGSPLVTYGAGAGGTVGAGLDGTWTVGLYFADGNVLGAADSTSGNGAISAALALASGTGSTAQTGAAATGFQPGVFFASQAFNAGGAAGDTLTVELVAFQTSAGSYGNAAIRGHSAAFTMTDAAINIVPKPLVGDFMSTFAVTPTVPEPSIFALAGLGAAALMGLRRKK
jgi:PEP-CTERM motif